MHYAATLCALSLSLLSGLPQLRAEGAKPARSASTSDGNLLESDRLRKEATKLAGEKKTEKAAEALSRSVTLRVQATKALAPPKRAEHAVIIAVDSATLGGLYAELGRNAEAARAFETAAAIYERGGKEERAKELRRLAERLREGATPKEAAKDEMDPDSAVLLDVMAVVALFRAGNTSAAAVEMDRLLPVLDKGSLGPDMLATATFVAGRVYEDSSQTTKAETYLKKALTLHEKAFGTSHERLVTPLKALGDFYLRGHEPERAAPLYLRAHDLAREKAPSQLPSIVMGLGHVVEARGQYAEAATLMRRARDLFYKEAGEKKDMGYLIATMGVADVEEEQNHYAEAARLYEEIRTELLPQYEGDRKGFAPFWASFLTAYGWHHRKRENWAEAEKLFQEAFSLKRALFAPKSLALANAECDIGEVYWASGDLERSLDPIQRCFDARDENVTRVLATGSEDQKRAYLATFLVAYQKTMTAQLLAGTKSPKLTRLALGQVLRTKGRVLDAMSGETQALRRGASPETQKLLSRLATVRTLLAHEAAGARDTARVQKLEEEARTLEQSLSEKSEAFRSAVQPVSVDSVRASIPSDHVLVELVRVEPLDPKYKRTDDKGAPHYLAYVVPPAGGPEPTFVDLGPASVIEVGVERLRSALRDPDVAATPAATLLYQKVVAPLEPHFGGRSRVIVSADGALNTIPFAALHNGKGYLVSGYTFSYVTSGRDLLRWKHDASHTKGVVVYANPTFEKAGESGPKDSRFSHVRFPPLPGTEAEANAIASLFSDAFVFRGHAATEAAIKSTSHPGILHLATHGFFLKDRPLALAHTRSLELDFGETDKKIRRAESPLLRSGLAFAGAASLRGGGGEDGILTALEASSLDLVGTKLVVLSACQTAEGEVSNGEGVYGLRRALAIAGAETMVMSLWSVDDEATETLMKGYYASLRKGEGRAEALRTAQKAMAQTATTSHPYYWGAFIPSGETSAITFDSPAPPVTLPLAKDTPKKPEEPEGDFGKHYSFPTLGLSLGVASLSVSRVDSPIKADATTLHFGIDLASLSALLPEIGIASRGFAFYDRTAFALSTVGLDGDVTASQLDYTAMLGYRTRFVGLFGGAMVGSGAISLDDSLEATGPFIPLAGRVELPWFAASRLTANVYGPKLGGARKVSGVDVRMPIGTPHFWLGVGYQVSGSRVGQAAEANALSFSLGLGDGAM